jgi:hypothetical protein
MGVEIKEYQRVILQKRYVAFTELLNAAADERFPLKTHFLSRDSGIGGRHFFILKNLDSDQDLFAELSGTARFQKGDELTTVTVNFNPTF